MIDSKRSYMYVYTVSGTAASDSPLLLCDLIVSKLSAKIEYLCFISSLLWYFLPYLFHKSQTSIHPSIFNTADS
ncbi:hypothetical protein Hanom_Chr10g00966751 [Helianthus anomalus]